MIARVGRNLLAWGILGLGVVSAAVGGDLPIRVAGLSFRVAGDFSVSTVFYDSRGYHYGDRKPAPRHLNVFCVPKSVPFVGDIFDSAELQRTENELKARKVGMPFSLFGATRLSSYRRVTVLDSLKLNEFEPQNISFERSIFLSDDRYFYVLSFSETDADFRKALLSQNPELFFQGEGGPRWIPEKLSQLYQRFSAHQSLPDHLEELNRWIDQTLDTLEGGQG